MILAWGWIKPRGLNNNNILGTQNWKQSLADPFLAQNMAIFGKYFYVDNVEEIFNMRMNRIFPHSHGPPYSLTDTHTHVHHWKQNCLRNWKCHCHGPINSQGEKLETLPHLKTFTISQKRNRSVKSKCVLLLPVIMHGSMVDTSNHVVCPKYRKYKIWRQEGKKISQRKVFDQEVNVQTVFLMR